MFEQLSQIVQQQAPQALAATPGVSGDQQQALTQAAPQSLFDGLQNLVRQNGPGALKGLFQGAQSGDTANPQVQQLNDSFTSNLSQKTGISTSIVKSIGAALIPMVLSQIFNRAKDPNDHSFSITDILDSLLGGNRQTTGAQAGGGGPLGSVLGGMLGGGTGHKGLGSMLDRDGDGDTDLADLMAMFR